MGVDNYDQMIPDILDVGQNAFVVEFLKPRIAESQAYPRLKFFGQASLQGVTDILG